MEVCLIYHCMWDLLCGLHFLFGDLTVLICCVGIPPFILPSVILLVSDFLSHHFPNPLSHNLRQLSYLCLPAYRWSSSFWLTLDLVIVFLFVFVAHYDPFFGFPVTFLLSHHELRACFYPGVYCVSILIFICHLFHPISLFNFTCTIYLSYLILPRLFDLPASVFLYPFVPLIISALGTLILLGCRFIMLPDIFGLYTAVFNGSFLFICGFSLYLFLVGSTLENLALLVFYSLSLFSC